MANIPVVEGEDCCEMKKMMILKTDYGYTNTLKKILEHTLE